MELTFYDEYLGELIFRHFNCTEHEHGRVKRTNGQHKAKEGTKVFRTCSGLRFFIYQGYKFWFKDAEIKEVS